MNPRLHLPLVALLALLVGVLYLQEPGFGDDLTYWAQAFDTHETKLRSLDRSSFHDLRWPVWGVCWAIQAVADYGIISYYGEPLLYLMLGASLAFVLGRRLLGSAPAGWAGAIAFLYHPLLDSVCFRPMPDLSEGILGAAIVASWWGLMNTVMGARAVPLAVLTGVLVYVAEANRVTGAFIVPVLIVNTLLFFRTRFFWLVSAGVVAAVCYAAEMWFLHKLFGDWLHAIHANMGNAGNKGTQPIAVWYLPFRFLDSLWKGNPLAPAYCILAALGIPQAWRNLGVFGRVTVLWFAILYFEYSCMPQPLWPIRPLIRDADRFLAGLAVPMALLAVCGLWWLWEKLNEVRRIRIPATALGAAALLVMSVVSSRTYFDLGFVPDFAAYMRALPPGTRVFTHESMRGIAFLCDPVAARKLSFVAPSNRILHRSADLEQDAAGCSEFWYARKLVWLNTRKKLELSEFKKQPQLASYFDAPEREWTLVRLLAKGDTPDLIFYRRRTPRTPPPQVLAASAPEFSRLVPPIPAEWRKEQGKHEYKERWEVPPSLRGKLVRIEVVAGSDQVEAFTLRLKFKKEGVELAEFNLKPYLHHDGGKDFFALPIPADADDCDVTLKFSTKAKVVKISELRVILEGMANP
jgi:hypothetical protein